MPTLGIGFKERPCRDKFEFRSNQLKILHLVTSLNPGGIERWVLTILENVDRKRHEIDICCQAFERGKWLEQATAFGAKVYLNPLTPDHVIFGIRLASILKKGKYDILQIHVGSYSGFPAWIASSLGVKTIMTIHSVQFPPYMWFLQKPVIRQMRELYARLSIKYAIQKSDQIIGVSQASLDAFVPDDERLRSKCHVIHHGVKPVHLKSSHDKKQFRSAMFWPEDSKLIVNVGRFNAQKNHIGLIDIFSEVIKSRPDARMVMVGDGVLRSDVEKQVRKRCLSESVAFLGFRDDAVDVMGMCDLMLMPSLYEGFGIVAIEAASAGLPLVGSKVSGLVEAVEDGKTGFLFPPDDVKGMATAVIRLFSDADLAAAIAHDARVNASAIYSVKKMIRKYCAIYESCVSN